MPTRPRFGVQRLYRLNDSLAERLLYQALGVADPAHFLHHRYLAWGLSLIGVEPTAILDAGCGSGDHTIYLAQRFPNAQVIGMDLNAEGIARCSATARRMGIANVQFEIGDLTCLARPASFDLIVSIDVLEHIPSQEETLRRLRDALRSGGSFFFHVPTIRPQPVLFDRWLRGFHQWAKEEHTAKERTADEFVALVRSVDLDVVRWRPTFGYYTGELATSLFNLPYAPTLRNRVIQALMAPACRLLALSDLIDPQTTRYAVAVAGRRP